MKTLLMLDNMPSKCVDCPISREGSGPSDNWKCPVLFNKANEYGYRTYKSCKPGEKLEDCPLIEINDNIAKIIEVAR